MTAQGLVRRDEKQRPREYVLTDAGRKRLEFFRSHQPGSEAEPGRRVSNPTANPGPTSESQPLDALKEEVSLQFQGLREDVHDLFESLGIRPRRGESPDVPMQVEELSKRLESLAEKTEEELAVVNLYRAQHDKPVQERIALLEGEVGEETAEKVARLVELEQQIDEESLRSVLALRAELNLPAEVVGSGEESTPASAPSPEPEAHQEDEDF